MLRYWLGQWDDALAGLSSDEVDDAPGLTATFLREGWPALLVHGPGGRGQPAVPRAAPV